MIIKFDELEERELLSFYGGKGALRSRMIVDENNKILRGKLVPGATIGAHIHETSSEIIFILTGLGKITCDGVVEYLKAGDCHYCPKGSGHAFENAGEEDVHFFAVVPNH